MLERKIRYKYVLMHLLISAVKFVSILTKQKKHVYVLYQKAREGLKLVIKAVKLAAAVVALKKISLVGAKILNINLDRK